MLASASSNSRQSNSVGLPSTGRCCGDADRRGNGAPCRPHGGGRAAPPTATPFLPFLQNARLDPAEAGRLGAARQRYCSRQVRPSPPRRHGQSAARRQRETRRYGRRADPLCAGRGHRLGERIEQQGLVETPHHDDPIDRLAVRRKPMAPSAAAEDRPNFLIKRRRGAPVEDQFGLAGAPPQIRGRKVEIGIFTARFSLKTRSPAIKTNEACVSMTSTRSTPGP